MESTWPLTWSLLWGFKPVLNEGFQQIPGHHSLSRTTNITYSRFSDGLRSRGNLSFMRKVWQFCTVLLAHDHDGAASCDTVVCPRICLPKHSMLPPSPWSRWMMLDDAASLDSLNAVTSAQPDLKSHLLREWEGVGGRLDADALSQVPITAHGWTVAHWGSFHRYCAGYGVDGHLWCCTALPSPHLQTHQTSHLPVFVVPHQYHNMFQLLVFSWVEIRWCSLSLQPNLLYFAKMQLYLVKWVL